VLGSVVGFVSGCLFGLVVVIFFDLSAESDISLLDKGELDMAVRQGDHGVLAFTNDEDVVDTGGEDVAALVTDVGDFEGTRVVLDVLEDSGTTNIVASVNKDSGSVFEFKDSVDLAVLEV